MRKSSNQVLMELTFYSYGMSVRCVCIIQSYVTNNQCWCTPRAGCIHSWASLWENVPSDMCVQRRLESAYQFSLSAWRNFKSLAIQNAPYRRFWSNYVNAQGWSESSLSAHVRRYVLWHWGHCCVLRFFKCCPDIFFWKTKYYFRCSLGILSWPTGPVAGK